MDSKITEIALQLSALATLVAQLSKEVAELRVWREQGYDVEPEFPDVDLDGNRIEVK